MPAHLGYLNPMWLNWIAKEPPPHCWATAKRSVFFRKVMRLLLSNNPIAGGIGPDSIGYHQSDSHWERI